MLQVQETVLHSTLMQPPMTVVVQPQPSLSSIKFVDQLNHQYELIQREIIATKTQIELAHQIKAQHEQEAIHYTNTNKEYRQTIKEIIKVLETKQTILESTKTASVELERKVKQFKDEALASRRQLEDLRRREQVLEHDCDVAVRERNQLKHQRQLLYDSIEQLKVRCEREMKLLVNDHQALVEQTQHIRERNGCMVELVELKIEQRRREVRRMGWIKQEVRANTDAFIEHVRSHLQAFNTELQQNTLQPKDCGFTVAQCRGEVNALVTKIKTIAAEITASEDKHH